MQYCNPNRSNYIVHFNGSAQTINTIYFFSSTGREGDFRTNYQGNILCAGA